MDESAQPSKRALAGLKSHKLNALNGLLTLEAKPGKRHVAAQPVPVKRLDVIRAYAADCALPAEDATASQIAQRFAPRQEPAPAAGEDRLSANPLAPPLLALASGARTLAAALIAVALLPNLVLAGLIWYGGIEPRWTSATEPRPEQSEASAMQTEVPVIRSVVTTPILLTPPVREAPLSSEVTSALPRGAETDEMRRAAPVAVSLPDAALQAAAIDPADEAQELAAASPQEDASAALAEPVPLPTRKPLPHSVEDEAASFIKATAYVNLRSAPSSGSSVVGVVAKGTKLRVVARKRGWVQVTDPATSKSGWIYGGNVAAAR